MLIALLEDDPVQREIIELWCADAGFEYESYGSGDKLIHAARNRSFDMFLLDWEVPGFDGMEVLRWLRINIGQTPVIFATAREHGDDIVKALEAGADDYLIKPLDPEVTIARIRAVARRSGIDARDRQVLSLPPFSIARGDRVIERDGEPVSLTRREYELALFLFERSGAVVARDALLSAIWGYDSRIRSRTIDTHISRLRKKLGLDGSSGWRIVTIHQYGYRIEKV